MNQQVPKILTLPGQYAPSMGLGLSGRGMSGINFSDIINTLYPKGPYAPARASHGTRPSKEIAHSYIEALRKRLLSRGKALNQVCLNRKDIPLLEKFLCHCGISRETVEKILMELREGAPHGLIPLSQFFLKIDEVTGTGHEERKFLGPSAVLRLESFLRSLGLTPQEIDRTLEEASVKGEGLDLDKFFASLKKNTDRKNPLSDADRDLKRFLKVAGEARNSNAELRAGRLTPESDNPGNRGIEKWGGATGPAPQDPYLNSGHGLPARHYEARIPPSVDAAIDGILKRAIPSKEREKSAGTEGLLLKMRALTAQEAIKRDRRFSVLENEPGRNVKIGKRHPDSSSWLRGAVSRSSSGKVREVPADLQGGKTQSSSISNAWELNRSIPEERRAPEPPAEPIHPSPRATASPFPEGLVIERRGGQGASGGPLPAYLIDQVSRQISRSMLAGERAIRFRLTPPELGTLKLVLKVNKNSVKVEMMTESSAAKEIILSNIGDLKAALLDQGVRLEKIDIQNSGGMFGQSFADWREGPGGRENRGGQEMQGMAAAPSSNDEAVEDPMGTLPSMGASNWQLDLRA